MTQAGRACNWTLWQSASMARCHMENCRSLQSLAVTARLSNWIVSTEDYPPSVL